MKKSEKTILIKVLGWLQRGIGRWFFPVKNRNWYARTSPNRPNLTDYLAKFLSESHAELPPFTDLKITEELIPAQLASTTDFINIDSISIQSKPAALANPSLNTKHIIKFLGANDHYENRLVDIILEAQATGAIVHAFNYPGIHRSTGRLKEFRDAVNAGIAVVNNLIKQGIHPDDIIFDGDCIGSAIAMAVRIEFSKKNILLRCIAGNTFSTVTASLYDQAVKYFGLKYIARPSLINSLLAATGWDYDIYKVFDPNTPYLGLTQRTGDLFLGPKSRLKTCVDSKLPDISTLESSTDQTHTWLYLYLKELQQLGDIKINPDELKNIKTKDGKADPHLASYAQCKNIFDYIKIYTTKSDEFLTSTRESRTIPNPATIKLPEYLEHFIIQPDNRLKIIYALIIICTTLLITMALINPYTVPIILKLLHIQTTQYIYGLAVIIDLLVVKDHALVLITSLYKKTCSGFTAKSNTESLVIPNLTQPHRLGS